MQLALTGPAGVRAHAVGAGVPVPTAVARRNYHGADIAVDPDPANVARLATALGGAAGVRLSRPDFPETHADSDQYGVEAFPQGNTRFPVNFLWAQAGPDSYRELTPGSGIPVDGVNVPVASLTAIIRQLEEESSSGYGQLDPGRTVSVPAPDLNLDAARAVQRAIWEQGSGQAGPPATPTGRINLGRLPSAAYHAPPEGTGAAGAVPRRRQPGSGLRPNS
ncbi:MAG: hypothetical protein ACRDPW_03270 [Mycobacteriales bacterium]